MAALEKVLAKIDANLEPALGRLFKLIEIKSISTDPAYAGDCAAAAQWLVDELKGLGFEASLRPTPGHPMIVAQGKAPRPDVPHVLFYGHYDVQPPDPLDLWETPPFEPRLAEVETGKQIVGRGVADDKGQLMTFVEACRAFKETGDLPCNITILIEGEEETGSPSLPAFLASHKDELKADLVLVCDTGMWDRTTPAITTMLRGLVLEEVVIHGADRDLHSGIFGGAAINPIRVLGRIISDLHDEHGHITLPGFYDGVSELPEEVAAQWRELHAHEGDFLKSVGLSVPAGEEGRSVLEMVWSRPTCDVNGVIGGYTGKGSKTVLPAQASAKFSFRLVGAQDPAKIAESFRAFVHKRLPADCRAEFLSHGASRALQLPFSSEALSRASRALLAEWGKAPVFAGCGGSIPIIGVFKNDLGMDSLMIGFGLEDDRVHSPNEKYELSSFHKGARSWARVLNALAL
ncbi:M20/M25/M40 family metallo-hydrolase [Methylocapsa polymorpha]|uniref:M20/M25/M40 family metallo-hydrolase n=1 Tax=Methylocapsa polymorpha TaxID=3080828 RepID=A0ABZ0HQ23_9HYPH|nr:M20/M25/M40 family metallo-hydrolase [Methylocapsa sp. RX1]